MSGSCVELSDDIDQELWITEKLILQHIGKLKDNKAAGTDELGLSFNNPLTPIGSPVTHEN